MSAIAASLILVGALTVLVVFTMVVENWSRLIQPLPVGPVGPVGPDDANQDDATQDDATPAMATTAAVSSPPPAGRPEGALVIGTGSLQLRDADTADVLAALLLAAYAASRRAAADRAAAWVTASATPPSLDAERFPPGVRLRGRPARVAQLLDAGDDGTSWVTLQTSVDVATGVARAPVKQATLSGLLSWWEHTRSLPTVIRATDAARIADAIGAIRPVLDRTTWSEPIGRLHDALRDAAEDREPLLVDLGRAARTGGQPSSVDPGSAVTSGSDGNRNRPSGPGGKSTTATTASRSSAP